MAHKDHKSMALMTVAHVALSGLAMISRRILPSSGFSADG